MEEAAAAAGSLQEQSQRLAEAVAVFKINAGEVIEVPASSWRSGAARRASRGAPCAEGSQGAGDRAAGDAGGTAAGAARDSTARVKPAAEGASTVRPLRRPAARKAEATDVTPVAPAAPPPPRAAGGR